MGVNSCVIYVLTAARHLPWVEPSVTSPNLSPFTTFRLVPSHHSAYRYNIQKVFWIFLCVSPSLCANVFPGFIPKRDVTACWTCLFNFTRYSQIVLCKGSCNLHSQQQWIHSCIHTLIRPKVITEHPLCGHSSGETATDELSTLWNSTRQTPAMGPDWDSQLTNGGGLGWVVWHLWALVSSSAIAGKVENT